MKVIEKIFDATSGDKYLIETQKCFHCGQLGEVTIESQELFYLNQGWLVQLAVKSLDEDEREQLISGTHPNCWEEMFGEEE
tara:strand:- start:5314 stop:5556 length:243 start_codon:yes stop_codon:yes gene_type:complete